MDGCFLSVSCQDAPYNSEGDRVNALKHTNSLAETQHKRQTVHVTYFLRR